MQGEFALRLTDHGHHAGVVRTRTHLAEPHLITLHEQLHAEDSATTETLGDRTGDRLRTRQCRRLTSAAAASDST